MKKILVFIFLTVFLASCQKEPDKVTLVELGVSEQQVDMACDGGAYTLHIYSNVEFKAEIDSDWLEFENVGRIVTGNSDMDITIKCPMNRHTQRSAVITVEGGGRRRSVTVVQGGLFDSSLAFLDHSVFSDSDAGESVAKFRSILTDDEIEYSVSYESQQAGWVSDVQRKNNFLSFRLEHNENPDSRYAKITATMKSDPKISDVLNVVQFGAGKVIVEKPISAVKEMLPFEGSVEIEEPVVFSGVVINDNEEGNGAPNANTSAIIQDNTLALRTLYIQDQEGRHGLKLVLNQASDNVCARYDHVTVMLEGATLVREEAPARYTITGVSGKNLISAKQGTRLDVPVKNRTIGELVDEDVNTFVTLSECEIPFRKGPYVPLDLRYMDMITRYPMPIRDKWGNSSFMMTNVGCAWQRDGKGLPQGSGPVSGIVVHETSDNFEWDVNLAGQKAAMGMNPAYITGTGNISRFQIRPQSKKDIEISESFESGFSGLIMEVRYLNSTHDELVKNMANNIIYPTYPLSPDPIHDSSINGRLEVINNGSRTGVLPWRDWTHLGPMDGKTITDKSGGNGVYDFFGRSAHWYIYSLVATTGLIYTDNGSGWYASSWHPGKCWQATFSTAGLTAANFPVSVQFGAENGMGESIGAPRYWTVEYSVDGKTWKPVADYTVPDFPMISNKKIWQCPGFKYMTFNLPEDSAILDKDEVKIRLRPRSDNAATADSYDGGKTVSSVQSALNYFAIRYNK